jgi:hypothetical protein
VLPDAASGAESRYFYFTRLPSFQWISAYHLPNPTQAFDLVVVFSII